MVEKCGLAKDQQHQQSRVKGRFDVLFIELERLNSISAALEQRLDGVMIPAQAQLKSGKVPCEATDKVSALSAELDEAIRQVDAIKTRMTDVLDRLDV